MEPNKKYKTVNYISKIVCVVVLLLLFFLLLKKNKKVEKNINQPIITSTVKVDSMRYSDSFFHLINNKERKIEADLFLELWKNDTTYWIAITQTDIKLSSSSINERYDLADVLNAVIDRVNNVDHFELQCGKCFAWSVYLK